MGLLEPLRQLQAMLSQYVEKVSLRGEGRGSFLFIESNGKAIEVSENDYRWWLEFWDSNEPDTSPTKELTLDTQVEVLKVIQDWLR